MSFLPLQSYKRQEKTRARKSEKRQERRPTESDAQTGGAGAGEGERAGIPGGQTEAS